VTSAAFATGSAAAVDTHDAGGVALLAVAAASLAFLTAATRRTLYGP
jgi:hypothetical protein